ncbi:DUF1656 domain-containing protein [Sphingobium sufflavum]|uniref:DUF1656 domain-containing protein n=1 Tax=Sphingobium sufflavum TaxID=1129547 RepID=UPI001F1A2487|nr:DUF1656 domain-containing protein [Sphingobium sufflavum]MCE7796353.1 DUF1656 domain-containing protein [Sphingobium sufflavum]
MIGETAIGGVFVPTLLLLAIAALILSAGLTRIVAAFGLYRFVAYRALVDPSLFILVFGLLAWLVPFLGYRL